MPLPARLRAYCMDLLRLQSSASLMTLTVSMHLRAGSPGDALCVTAAVLCCCVLYYDLDLGQCMYVSVRRSELPILSVCGTLSVSVCSVRPRLVCLNWPSSVDNVSPYSHFRLPVALASPLIHILTRSPASVPVSTPLTGTVTLLTTLPRPCMIIRRSGLGHWPLTLLFIQIPDISLSPSL